MKIRTREEISQVWVISEKVGKRGRLGVLGKALIS
jgi:hypothetical protein